MRIDKLHLKNFRCFEDIEFEFHPQFNLIVGENATGKRALLDAISLTLVATAKQLDRGVTDRHSTADVRRPRDRAISTWLNPNVCSVLAKSVREDVEDVWGVSFRVYGELVSSPEAMPVEYRQEDLRIFFHGPVLMAFTAARGWTQDRDPADFTLREIANSNW